MNVRIPLGWLERLQLRFGFRIYFLTGEPRVYYVNSTHDVLEYPTIGLRLVVGNRNIRRYHLKVTRAHPDATRPGVDA